MSELLFENNEIKEALENLLALNQIKKYDSEINKYTAEIQDLRNEMAERLSSENIDKEFVERINKYKTLLTSMEGDSCRIGELDETIVENEDRIKNLQKNIKEVEEKLEALKDEIFNTTDPSRIISCQNEIESNNIKLNDLNEILNNVVNENTPLMIEKEYLKAKNSDVDFNIPNMNKNEISDDLKKAEEEFDSILEKLDLPIRENIEFCQKKIQNREIEIEKFTEKKNSVINAFPDAVLLNVEKAYTILTPLLEELDFCKCDKIEENNESDLKDYKESEETEIENIEPKVTDEDDIKNEISNLDVEDDSEENIVEEKRVEDNEIVENEPTLEPQEEKNEESEEKVENSDENSAQEPETKEAKEDEEIGSVSYILSDGESLMNIAEKVYPSKDNWEAIYYFNKNTIDNYLISNGISNDFDNIKELAQDTSVFTGIKLEIPTDYNYKI